MLQITKSYFDKALNKQFTKFAVLINGAFQSQKDHFDNELNRVETKLENKIDTLENKVDRIEGKVDKALHIEYVRLETRVKKIENKLN